MLLSIKYQGSLDCIGNLRHIQLQIDREGVPPNSKRGIGMSGEFFYQVELELKYKMIMLEIWFDNRICFNKLLRVWFNIRTCFNKLVIVLEKGAVWFF